MDWWNFLKFGKSMYRHKDLSMQHFQPWPWLMTSSRRHFVKIKSLSYLHNGKSIFIQICHDESQFHSSQVRVHKCARTSTSARINKNCSNWSEIHFAYYGFICGGMVIRCIKSCLWGRICLVIVSMMSMMSMLWYLYVVHSPR